MDIQQQIAKPSSDDQELAKVLSGIDDSQDDSASDAQDDLVPQPLAPPPALVSDDVSDGLAPTMPQPPIPAPLADDPVTLPPPDVALPATPSIPVLSGLDGVKQDAIRELRPLVDKLTLAPEERFDTYLLLIRSTDDSTLITPAHEAAKQIVDESRRAQALLDIIKEIDFLSSGQS